jgi:hypothetical protein
MTYEDVDYRPLAAMDDAWSTTMHTALGGMAWPVAMIVVAFSTVTELLIGSFMLFIAPLVILFLYLASQVNKFQKQMWQQFARANGWTIDTKTNATSLVPPSLQFGHSHHFSAVVQAKLASVTCDLLAYDCTTGSGKSSETHYFTVALTSAPKPMPHAVLTPKKYAADLQGDFVNGENLKLEGNFQDYFSLKVEKGQEVDVLTVLTPDVMQTIVQYNQAEHIELLGSNIYFIVRGDKRKPGDVRQLLKSVTELSQQLQENARLSSPVWSSSLEAPTPSA